MNRNESKYFYTAIKMDKAFLELFEKKDYSYITVKEICSKAKINRSTFYLHYETIEDLLMESVDYMNKDFLAYMSKNNASDIISHLQVCSLEDLNLVTSKYLKPYLSYIKENKRLFLTALKKNNDLRVVDSYNKMYEYVLNPIMERFHVPTNEREYLLFFYIHGIMGIISKWIEKDCLENIDDVVSMIQHCVNH